MKMLLGNLLALTSLKSLCFRGMINNVDTTARDRSRGMQVSQRTMKDKHMQTVLGIAVLWAAVSSPAFAVDLTNEDGVAHSVFVCDSTCKPPRIDHNYSRGSDWGGKVLTLGAGETRFNVCNGECVIVVEDGVLATIEDLGFSERFSGSDKVAISGKYRKLTERRK